MAGVQERHAIKLDKTVTNPRSYLPMSLGAKHTPFGRAGGGLLRPHPARDVLVQDTLRVASIL